MCNIDISSLKKIAANLRIRENITNIDISTMKKIADDLDKYQHIDLCIKQIETLKLISNKLQKEFDDGNYNKIYDIHMISNNINVILDYAIKFSSSQTSVK